MFPDRRPKPALWEHKQLAAPVRVTPARRAGVVQLSNRQDFSDLAWLRASYELADEGEVVAQGDLALPGLAPGEKAEVRIPGWRRGQWL